MKFGVFALFLAILLSVAFAKSDIGYFGNPNYPGKCVIRDDYIVNPGNHKDPTQCAKIVCSPDGMGAIHTCNQEPIPEGCKDVGPVHKKKAYPECCKRKIVCKNKKKN